MDTSTTETGAPTETGAGEGESNDAETISIPKKEWETHQQTLGSLKRELKDLKKPKEETKETPQTKTENTGLLQKSYLRTAGISDAEK